jgi:TonB family protein
MSVLVTGPIVLAFVIAVALLAGAILRRQSAARRHAVLAAALLVGSAAPVFAPFVPTWNVPVPWQAAAQPPASATGSTAVAVDPVAITTTLPLASTEPVVPAVTLWGVVLVVWLAGAIVVLAGLATGVLRLARLIARCTPVVSGPWREAADALGRRSRLSRRVVLLQSDDPSLLLTCGLFHPRIVLPADAADWPAARREVVLAHELAHIRRHDWAVLMAAEVVRAAHWFNPLVWTACRRLRRESEFACDDAVLNEGVAATEYASHLLAVARQAAGRGRAWATAPAVADPSTLERRIAAMLNHTRRREPMTRPVAALAVAGALAMTIPLAALGHTPDAGSPLSPDGRQGDVILTAPAALDSPPAAQAPTVPGGRVPAPVPAPDTTPVPTPAPGATPVPSPPPTPGEISGVVRDSSGGVLPGARLTLAEMNLATERETLTDGAGRFWFRNVPPGRYSLVTSLPGFARVRQEFAVATGERVERDVALRLGMVVETITVSCPATTAASEIALQPVAFVPGTYVQPRRSGLADERTLINPATALSLARQGTAVTVPVRVGGNVRPPRRITFAAPACPRIGMPDSGTVVILEAVISVDGAMTTPRVLRPAAGATHPAPELAEAALAAVRRWRYTPAQLNGQPVPVIVTITVVFSQPR